MSRAGDGAMFYKAARAISGFRKLSLPDYSKPQKKLLGHFEKAFHHVSGEAKSEAFSETRTNFIHPTAFVHPDAILGHNVTIGPFCSVGSDVKLGNACHLHPGSHIFGDTELGDHCTLLAGAIVGADIPGQTIIGSKNTVGHHAVVGAMCQDLKYKVGDECFLYVGDNNDIREHTSIHRSSKSCDRTVIGNNNLIMGSCHIAHDCKVGNNNIFANNTLLAGHVVVEDFIHTAGAIVVHQFCHLGSFSFVGGGSVVSQDIPRYMMVAGERAELRGLNLEGLRRHGFSSTEVKCMRRAYRKIFLPNNEESAQIAERLAEVEKDEELSNIPVVCSMVQSIRDSFELTRRGICKFRQWNGS
ncbi:hypothetical protein H6P81_001050 [Aristolochia fimbriata]|uniref:UDP N-acetylglucosamine O-acyltransferase C-terminal domain-containing protein n=1 Tax=Aristolochia fimbriata TaxID=158543 RepID=A0AAV7F9T3_ARIFI|nr:hypothetical protein H6P81_001050 [Aristolochia fimbriata]